MRLCCVNVIFGLVCEQNWRILLTCFLQLASWVRGIREKRASNLRKGIDIEEMPVGKKGLFSKILTAERIKQLDDIGFAWSVAGPKVKWEDRFQDMMDYYEQNGKWPSQSMGSLGEWIHKQRTNYARKDKNYMKTKAPKLDAVGFEWTPRGNTRMGWEEGFKLLVSAFPPGFPSTFLMLLSLIFPLLP